MSNTNPKLGRLAKLGLLAALSIVLVFFIHFPIFPTAKFLEYDPADIPIMIATFAFGPWYGLMTTIVVAVVQGLTVSASSGIYGIIMHIIATGTFVLVAGFLYQKHKTKKGALIALLCGVVAWGLIMMPANLIITPHLYRYAGGGHPRHPAAHHPALQSHQSRHQRRCDLPRLQKRFAASASVIL